MMRLLLPFVFFSSWLIACQSGKDAPDGIIPEKKMKLVIWDMMRADQFLTDFVFSRDTSVNKLQESVKLYKQIFAIHKVTLEQFKESFTYYREHPGTLKQLLDSVAAVQQANVPAGTDPALPPQVQPGQTQPTQSQPTQSSQPAPAPIDTSRAKPVKKIRDLKAL